MKSTETFSEWKGKASFIDDLRSLTRDTLIRGLAIGRHPHQTNNWIRFPYYHHVFLDERKGFARQIRYLKSVGEFITIEDAISLINSEDQIDGRYFCLTFDDGLKSCWTGAVPILVELNVSATFYVITGLVGKSFNPDDNVSRNTLGFKGINTALEFIDWNECRSMSQNGMTIGSHTENHFHLNNLPDNKVRNEMLNSKVKIEYELGTECRHFCAPYGNLTDNELKQLGNLACSLGYVSFATGTRGANKNGDSAFALKRDHLLSNWGIHQLKYFFSRR